MRVFPRQCSGFAGSLGLFHCYSKATLSITTTRTSPGINITWRSPLPPNRSAQNPKPMRLASLSSSRRPITMDASPFPSLVSVSWLKNNLSKVRVLDASWYMPNQNKDALQEFCTDRIPGSLFFDLDGVADHSTDLPHMLPSEQQFEAAADALGISNNDTIVLYDCSGIFSSPRAWWTWHALGHERVAVLDGGMPAWKVAGGEIDSQPIERDDALVASKAAAAAQTPSTKTGVKYKALLRKDEVRSWQQMLHNIEYKEEIVVDARPAPRFRGEAREPRPGLVMGHIPGSFNVPWDTMLQNGCMKSTEELKKVFADAGVDLGKDKPVVATCGSGTTACILALAVRQAAPKAPPVSIYDGSWSEWGRLPDVLVATAAQESGKG